MTADIQEEKYIDQEYTAFRERVFIVVAAIPYGKVTTYGNIAHQAGSSRAARQVGNVLKNLPTGSSLPWHRVVNRHGKISLCGENHERQKHALLAENIAISARGNIDLALYGWYDE